MSGDQRVVLITGGAGFVGSNLCRTLLGRGDMVYAVDNLVTGRRENIAPVLSDKNFRFFELDINNPHFFQVFKKYPVQYIYHLACPTGVPNIDRLCEEMILTSSVGTRHVLELARLHHSKMLFTSSCEVYGQPQVFPQRESYSGNVDSVGPRSPYEEGKRFSEALIAMYVRKYGVMARIIRIFNTYGPGMSLSDHRVVPSFLRAVLAGEPLRVYGDGRQTRTHLYIDDLIKGILLAITVGKEGEIYNVGGVKQVTVKELAELLIRLTGHSAGISFQPHFIEDHQHRLPSVEKVEQLGWKQTVALEDGLQRMLTACNIPLVAEELSADTLLPQ